MVGIYKRNTNRQAWSRESMRLAIERGGIGWLAAAKQYNVPQATLRRRAQNKRVKGTEKGLGRFSTTFPADMENELVNHIKSRENMLFGLTVTDLRKLAYDFAETNNLDHRFRKTEKMAGFESLRDFRLRHPEVSLRKPEPTSAARAEGFNKPQIAKFFAQLENHLDTFKFPPNNIYNMDESALSTVQIPPKIFASKGKKQVGSITSAERGTHTTMVCCMNAIGSFVPPALIFARKKYKKELVDDAPIGTLLLCQESGWMTGELFLLWLKHLVKHSRASLANQILLILDGHSSHKYYPALKYAKENGVTLMCLPPHCTHRIQPLDVTFFGPLSAYYNQEVDRWLKCNSGRVVTQFQIGKLFSVAYGKAATTAVATSGFAKTGIFPLNSDIFPDYMFLPSSVTDQPLDQPHNTAEVNPARLVDHNVMLPSRSDGSAHTSVSLSVISPPPKKGTSTEKKRKSVQVSGVLTNTPELEEIKAKYEKKLETEKRKSDRNKVKKKIIVDNESDGEQNVDFGEMEVSDEEDASCIYCNELYTSSKSKETWIRCQMCLSWCHTDCAGVDRRVKQFICEICLD